jgi:ABC-type branched-subunit amino acid transport system substrate-binding protein
VALVLVASACRRDPGPATHAPAPVVIKMGALADTSGTNAAFAYRQAILLALAQVNDGLAQAGANLRFDLQIKDTHSSAVSSREAGIDLVNNWGAKALVSDVSADTVALAKLDYDPANPLAQKVPITCSQCSSSFLNNPNAVNPDPLTQTTYRDAENWIYRVFFVSAYESSLAVQIALRRGHGDTNGDGQLRLAVYASKEAFGESCESGIRAAAKTLAPSAVVSTVWYDPTQDARTYDFDADARKLMTPEAKTGAVPDMVYLAVLGTPTTKIIRAFRAGHYTAQLQSTTALRRNYIVRDLGADADGIEGASPPLVANNASGRAFATAFQEANGIPPEFAAAGTYDAAVALMLAAMQAAQGLAAPGDVTPVSIRDALPAIFDPAGIEIRPAPGSFAQAYAAMKSGKRINYSGASGYLPWDAAGDNHPPMVHWRVQNRQFVELETYQCDAAHPTCVATTSSLTRVP